MERDDRARLRTRLCALAVAALLGCVSEGDAGEHMDVRAANGAAAGAGPGAEPESPHFGEVYAILGASCGGGMSGCHITGTAAQLALPDAASAHVALVDVGSRKCAGELLVVPGDADASVLVQVLEGTTQCAKAMPLGREPLGPEAIAIVRAWIDGGAMRD